MRNIFMNPVYLLICWFALLSPSVIAETVNHPHQLISNKDIKHSIEEIVEKDPFPRKITEKRWTLDIKNELKLDENDIESSSLPRYLIEFIALMSEHILLMVIIIVVLLLYFNRHLLNIDNISFNFSKIKAPLISEKEMKTTEAIEQSEVDKQLPVLYEKKDYRKLISLIYQYIIQQSEIPDYMTEQEICRLISAQQKQNILLGKIITLRIESAYQHLELKQEIIDQILIDWKARN